MHISIPLSRNSRVVVAVLASLALGAATLVAQAPPAEAAAPALSANRTSVIAGEPVTLTGRLSTKLKRPVSLQVKVGKAWRAVATKNSTAAGVFTFVAKPRATSIYRAYAPAKVVAGKQRTAVTSGVRQVGVVAQSAAAYTLPGLAHYGTSAAASSRAQLVVASRFAPVRSGRTVVLQQLSGGSWKNIATSKQNNIGSAAFRMSNIPTGSLRAVALASGGAAAYAKPVTRRTWTATTDAEFGNPPFGKDLPNDWFHRQLEVYPGGKRVCSRTTKDMVTIRNGVAEISAQADSTNKKPAQCPRGTYKNGHIATEFTVGYGIAAARVKFQQADGQHGAFWLQSQTSNGGSEIDVAEYFGAGRADGGLKQFIHYRDSKGKDHTSSSSSDKTYPARLKLALASSSDDWWKAYHVFSVEWTPTMYIFRIDGVETFRTNKGLTSRQAILVLSHQTSDYELPNNDGSKRTTYVDWVRTWSPS